MGVTTTATQAGDRGQMAYHIDIRDATAGLLAGAFGRAGRRTVTVADADAYGRAIVARMESRGYEIVFHDTRYDLYQMVHECSDIFEFDGIDGSCTSVTLKDGIPCQELSTRFVMSLPIAVLKAALDEQVKQVAEGLLANA